MFSLVPVANANLVTLVKSVDRVVLNPLIILMFAVALVFFLYGVVVFLFNQDNEEKRKDGKNHMLWGIFGMFIMFSVFLIIEIILKTWNEKGIKATPTTIDVHLTQ